ncbi:MAG: hypothetical protein WAM53_08745 [Terrimicrobiaceae bacterium]
MPNPKNFAPNNAVNENYVIDANNPANVILYRFGDRNKPLDWLSRKRQANHGNYVRPSDSELNDWAILQCSYGSKSENAENNPFLSTATNYADLFQNGEIWVQGILRQVPDVAEFSVPFDRVFRSSPTKTISKTETEWVYYDGDEELLHWLVRFIDNPYKV